MRCGCLGDAGCLGFLQGSRSDLTTGEQCDEVGRMATATPARLTDSEVSEIPSASRAASLSVRQAGLAQCHIDTKAGEDRYQGLPVLYRLADLLSRPANSRVVYRGPIPYQGLERFAPHCLLNRILRKLFCRWVISLELVRVLGERTFGIWKLPSNQNGSAPVLSRADTGPKPEPQIDAHLTETEWREFVGKWPSGQVQLPAKILQASHPLRELLTLWRDEGRPDIQSLLAKHGSSVLGRTDQDLTEGQS